MVERRVQDPNFIAVTGALNESGVPYFVGGGTLLRLHRDGDFAPESGDIDICFREGDSDRAELEGILRKLNFEVEYSDEQNLYAVRDGGRKIDLNFFSRKMRKMSDGSLSPHEVIMWTVFPRDGLQPSFYFTWHRVTNLITGRSQPLGRLKQSVARVIVPVLRPFEVFFLSIDQRLEKRVERHVEYRIPSSLIATELIVTKTASWYQPVEVEAVLEALYGTDWRIPTRLKDRFGFARDSPS